MANESEAQPQADVVPQEGDLLAGKYRIERVLGQGGMGVVVAAHHETLRQKVAVKFLLPEAAKRADSKERFLREARAAVAIQSEHVARVMDVGTLENGSPYMVMELLSGDDLGVILKARGALPIDEAVDYVLQASEAIAEAHSLGIIHRDLKPANLFLSRRADGSSLVKVLDFGLSKATKLDAMDASLTAANAIMGSPFYMSPEQIRSLKAIDARADVWALGVILYQLLTGKRPFEGEAIGALFLAIASDDPPPPSSLRPDLPPALEAAILKCLEKSPKNRPQSVAELAHDIVPFGTEDSRISVERIHRVLVDSTAFPRRSSIAEGSAPALALEAAAGGSKSRPPPASSSPDIGSSPSSPSNPPVAAKSGSMIAVASSVAEAGASATPPPPASATPRAGTGPRNAVIGIAAVALLGGAVGIIAGRMRPPTSGPAPTTEAAASSPVVSAPVVASAAIASASPSAAAPVIPTASAATSAEPIASAAPPASAKAGAAGKSVKPPVIVKKTKDPLDRWK